MAISLTTLTSSFVAPLFNAPHVRRLVLSIRDYLVNDPLSAYYVRRV